MGIRVGVIGTGFGAKVHVPVLQQHPDYELEAICSLRKGRAAMAATELGVPHGYDDWRKMLDELALDMVVIASEPALHKEITAEALNRNCHVLCEKPPALGEAEALLMQEVAVRSGKVSSMNFEWRYLPERKKIKEFIDNGSLGEIFHVNWSTVGPMWPSLRDREDSWLWHESRGGGLLGAVGSHMIDALQYWLGSLTEIRGMVTNHVPSRRRGSEMVATTADDSFLFHGRFTTGATCSVQFSIGAVGRDEVIEVIGSRGTAQIRGKRVQVATTNDALDFRDVELPSLRDVSAFDGSIQGYIHPQWELYSEFAQVVRGGSSETLPTMEDVVRVQRVLDQIRRPD